MLLASSVKWEGNNSGAINNSVTVLMMSLIMMSLILMSLIMMSLILMSLIMMSFTGCH